MLWAGPWSLVGLALAPFFSRRYVDRGALWCVGAGWPRRLGWRYRAITFGHVVLCVDAPDPDLVRHELVHVEQYETWGPFFVPVYLVAAASAALRGGHPHDDNRFEVAAQRNKRSR